MGSNDVRVEKLLRSDGPVREREIERLIVDVARPVVSAVLARAISSALRPQDADDIAAVVDLRLLGKLRELAEANGEGVQDLERYVATLTQNAIHDHLRRAFPARARLKNRIRYLLVRDARFALWSHGGTLVCGLAAWRDSTTYARTIDLGEAIPHRMHDEKRAADVLAEVFARVNEPAALDAVVDALAALWNVVDLAPAEVAEDVEVVQPEGTKRMERRELLAALWTEVRELRPLQRKALLLHLRGSGTPNGLSLLVVSHVATFEDLATALQLTSAELTELWPELPLDDLRIAEHLGVTRQQVINLRKSARERLARRTRAAGTASYWPPTGRSRR